MWRKLAANSGAGMELCGVLQRLSDGRRSGKRMAKIRISMVAMDLDGTLLGVDSRISPENAEALRKCSERGIRVVMASGRSFEAIRSFACGLGIECAIISCNGARTDETAEGPLLMEDCIPEAQAIELFEALRKENIYFECYTPGKIYMTDGFAERFHAHKAKAVEMDGRRLEYIDGAERMRREAMGCAYKFVVFSPDVDRLSQVAQRMREFDISVTSSWSDNIELMKKGAGKGKALSAYAALKGIPKEEIMAFGDQINDLDLLSASGWPVAMENAVPELKAFARLTAPHHDQSGVGKIIRKYILDEGETI